MGLQYAHDLALGLQRHVGDFVEEERAAVGAFEGADLAGAAAPFGAEQFRLQAVRPHHRGVDHDERPRGAARPTVDQARDHLLSHARRPSDKDPAFRGRDPLRRRAHQADSGGLADEFLNHASAQLELGDLPSELGRFQRPPHHEQQAVALERLFDELVGTLLDRGDGGIDRAVSADHDDWNLRVVVAHDVQQPHAVEIAPAEPDVEEDERRRRPGIERLERSGAVARDARRVSLVFEKPGDLRPDIGFVVDDQDVVGHSPSPFVERRLSSAAAKTSATRAPPRPPPRVRPPP